MAEFIHRYAPKPLCFVHLLRSPHSVHLADEDYDFSDTDMVATVFPSEHFGGAVAGAHVVADGKTLRGFRLNTHVDWDPFPPPVPGLTAAHKLVHLIGTLELPIFPDQLYKSESVYVPPLNL